ARHAVLVPAKSASESIMAQSEPLPSCTAGKCQEQTLTLLPNQLCGTGRPSLSALQQEIVDVPPNDAMSNVTNLDGEVGLVVAIGIDLDDPALQIGHDTNGACGTVKGMVDADEMVGEGAYSDLIDPVLEIH